MNKVNTLIDDYKELYCTKIKNSLNDKYRNMDMNNIFEILQNLTEDYLQQESKLNNKINKIKNELRDNNNNNDKICHLEDRLLLLEKNNKDLLFQNKKMKDKYMKINNIYKKLQRNCFKKNETIKKENEYKDEKRKNWNMISKNMKTRIMKIKKEKKTKNRGLFFKKIIKIIENINKTSSNKDNDKIEKIKHIENTISTLEGKIDIIQNNLVNNNNETTIMKETITKQNQEVKYWSVTHQTKIKK